MKIDLQIHTNYSDGVNSPKEIIELAKQGGLDVISVTDHDTLLGQGEVKDEGENSGLKVIPGVEISTTYKDKTLHILGYGIDFNNLELVNFLKGINEFRKTRFLAQLEIINENLRQAGRGQIDAVKYSQKIPKYYSYPGLALFLFEEGIIDSEEEFFNNNYHKGLKNTASAIEPAEAIKYIHAAGGKAVLSHPLAPKIALVNITSDEQEQEKIIEEFVGLGLDGLECFQACHREEDKNRCLAWAEKYNLIVTAGSDWHGTLEQKGEKVKEYVPFYINKLGDLVVPDEWTAKIMHGLGYE